MANFLGIAIDADTIVDFLKQELHLKEICKQIVCRQLIIDAAQERGVVVTPAEIQNEADQQRYQQRLESAAATFAWLNDHLLTPEEWEAGIHDRLVTKKLADSLFAQDVERVFAERRLDFEQVSLYRIRVPYQQLAQELLYQIEENEISFYEAAHLYDIDEQRRSQCGFEGKLYRWKLHPDLAAIVFAARAGELLGPLPSESGFDLLMPEEFISAELTAIVRQELSNQLFMEWLEGEFNYYIHHRRSTGNSSTH